VFAERDRVRVAVFGLVIDRQQGHRRAIISLNYPPAPIMQKPGQLFCSAIRVGRLIWTEYA
jgi:hypothetical protein